MVAAWEAAPDRLIHHSTQGTPFLITMTWEHDTGPLVSLPHEPVGIRILCLRYSSSQASQGVRKTLSRLGPGGVGRGGWEDALAIVILGLDEMTRASTMQASNVSRRRILIANAVLFRAFTKHS